MDESVGRILQALKDLGIENNTLVVFTSDNGPEVKQMLSCLLAALDRALIYAVL
jgi:arylsulfatase A-like enzyme